MALEKGRRRRPHAGGEVTIGGISENLALGVALIGNSLTGVLSLLAAVWASNLPDVLGSEEHEQ